MIRTVRKPAGVTGYETASDYDAESDRLHIRFSAFTEEERVSRTVLAERTLTHRNQQAPLGSTTAELIREARAEAYGDDA